MLLALTYMYNPYRPWLKKVSQLAKEDYLSNLRENTTFGCKTFLARKADILVLGDSHAFAGIDFNTLANGLKTESLSACPVGAFYIETFPLIQNLIEKNEGQTHYVPKVIILGTSPRQFIDDKLKYFFFGVQRDYLEQQFTIRDFLKGIKKTGLQFEELTTDKTFVTQNKNLAFHGPKIEGMTPQSASNYIETFPGKGTEYWRDFIEHSKFTDGIQEKIQKVCVFVKKKHIALFVVDIPESPFLEKMEAPTIRKKYLEILNQFSSCAKIVVEPPSYYGIDDRHFFNRYLDEKFDYNTVKDLKHVESKDYDLDHMNLVGAHRFTKKFSAILEPEISVILNK